MNTRRSVLRSGAVVVGTGAVVGLAGCTVDVGNPDATPGNTSPSGGTGAGRRDGQNRTRDDRTGGPPPDDGSTPTPHSGGTPAVDFAPIRTSFGELLADMRGAVEDEDRSLDDVEPREKLEAIDQQLEDVDGNLGSDQRDQFRRLRTLRGILGRLLDATDSLEEASVSTDEAIASFEAESYDDAIADLEAARDGFGSASRGLERVRSRFEEIESTVDEYEEVDAADMWTVVAELESIADLLSPFRDAMAELSQASREFAAARDDYDAERWRDAEEAMTRTRGRFQAAAEQFTELRPDAPEGFRDTVERYRCVAVARADAADHYATASRAAREGDRETAEAAEAEAEAALARCE